MSVTAEQFVEAFQISAEQRGMGDAVVANWEWLGNRPPQRDNRQLPPRGQVTTDDLTRLSQRVLFDIADMIGLSVTWECPPTSTSSKKLDAVLFNGASRKVEVAWEHEGLRAMCEDEIERLRLYGAPLSVLVTYLRPDKRRQDKAADWVQRYKAWFEQTDVGDRDFLVIFATIEGKWEFYQYRPGGFISIQPGNRQ